MKQVLHLLVNDMGGLGNEERVELRLRLDSKCASLFHEAWARQTKTSLHEIVVHSAGDAQTGVFGGPDFNEGEPCGRQHKVKRILD